MLPENGVNRKLTYRLYREEGLGVRRRKRKRVSVPRTPMDAPTEPNERWSMDFVSDALADGRKIRSLAQRPRWSNPSGVCERAADG